MCIDLRIAHFGVTYIGNSNSLFFVLAGSGQQRARAQYERKRYARAPNGLPLIGLTIREMWRNIYSYMNITTPILQNHLLPKGNSMDHTLSNHPSLKYAISTEDTKHVHAKSFCALTTACVIGTPDAFIDP